MRKKPAGQMNAQPAFLWTGNSRGYLEPLERMGMGRGIVADAEGLAVQTRLRPSRLAW